MDEETLNHFTDAYRVRRDEIAGFTTQIEELLKRLIDGEGLAHHDVQSRCKEIDSYRQKIIDKNYTDPIEQLMDSVGVRAVMYYDADVDLVAALIRREFSVEEDHSEDKRSPSNEQYFGYRSYHLVATIDDRRAASTEYARFKNERIEFQVRSMLAHTWEAIDRQMDYKQEQRLSSKGKRLMGRVSAMLETADELFNQLRDHERAYRAAQETQQEEADEPGPPTLRW